jgi:hypothetical protein
MGHRRRQRRIPADVPVNEVLLPEGRRFQSPQRFVALAKAELAPCECSRCDSVVRCSSDSLSSLGDSGREALRTCRGLRGPALILRLRWLMEHR